MSHSLRQLLQMHFSYNGFREGQQEIIQELLTGRDALAILPTGKGKSLCYQLPAKITGGLTIVVSPLLSLINDQVRYLKAKGIPAAAIHSELSPGSLAWTFLQATNSSGFILYITPERIENVHFNQWLAQQKVSLIAIDEAHCISQWGDDFRPAYKKLHRLRRLFPSTPILALTATACLKVQRDIIFSLGQKNPYVFRTSIYRKNLFIEVKQCGHHSEKLPLLKKTILKFLPGTVLIYSTTRRHAETWAASLSDSFNGVSFYHAGLDTNSKREIEQRYLANQIPILVATSAFGMGVHHDSIRLLIHTEMPGSLESYTQELGRAGRDSKSSHCLLLFSPSDIGIQSHMIRQSSRDSSSVSKRWTKLNAMIDYCKSFTCRHARLIHHFDCYPHRILRCGHCDICVAEQSSYKNHSLQHLR